MTIKDLGFRTSIQLPADVKTLIQRERNRLRRLTGFAPTRSEVIVMALRLTLSKSGKRKETAP